MENFEGKIAVITGGGTGMGRELTYQLAAEGCHVSICDVIEENMEETFQEASKKYPLVKITKQIIRIMIDEPNINPLLFVFCAKTYAIIGKAAKIVKR